MNLIEQSVEQISKESFRNYYDREQAEEELITLLTNIQLIDLNSSLIKI